MIKMHNIYPCIKMYTTKHLFVCLPESLLERVRPPGEGPGSTSGLNPATLDGPELYYSTS